MNRIVAASGAFNAFGSISCMLIVKRIWTCHMEFALYKLITIISSYHHIHESLTKGPLINPLFLCSVKCLLFCFSLREAVKVVQS